MEHPATTPLNNSAHDYLNYYLSLDEPPKFAVLINGGWGAGKTHLIQKFIADNFEPEPKGFRGWLTSLKTMILRSWIIRTLIKKTSDQPDHSYLYVSLYGTESVEDINDRIICCAFPGLKVSTAKVIGGITRSALKYFRVETQLTLKNFISRFHRKIYIFDDFERSKLPSKVLLGYINDFVEHGDKKVIIIANEDEIEDKDKQDYLNTREKVIGKSLTVQTMTDEALDHFTGNLKHHDTRQLIADMRPEIIRIFRHSGSNNLRSLRQALRDFERLFIALAPQQQQHSQAMTALARIFLILSLEIRQKNITADDILKRPGQTSEFFRKIQQSKPEEQAFIEMENRHPTVDLRDPILPGNLLVEILIQGVVNPDVIQASLMSSAYFIREEDRAALDLLKYPLELTEERFHKALAQFEADYKERVFVTSQDLFTTFTLRLWLSSKRLLPIAHSRVLAQGKQYLQDLHDAKRLPILTQKDFDDVRYSVFTGNSRLPFGEERSKEAEAYFKEFERLSQSAQGDLDAASAVQLLEDMKNDAERLVFRLSYSSHLEPDHVYPAILLRVRCADFVSTLLELHPKQQQTVLNAFKKRYDFTPIFPEQTGESQWLLEVSELILAQAEQLSLFEQERLRSNVYNFLDPYSQRTNSLTRSV